VFVLGFAQVLQDPAAWGAFLSGCGAVIGAMFSLRRTKKRADDQCEQRIRDIKEAFTQGTRFERRAEAHGRRAHGQ